MGLAGGLLTLFAILIPSLVSLYGIDMTTANATELSNITLENKLDIIINNQQTMQTNIEKVHDNTIINSKKIQHINLILCKNHSECEVLK